MTKDEKIKLAINKKWVDFESVTWSGTDTQCSRELSFSIPSNAYDKNFKNIDVSLGDMVYLYNGKTRLFVGTVTSRSRPAGAGTATYTARDFMHHLLRSNTTRKFKDKTPEQVVKSICKEAGVGTSSLIATKVNIPKIWFEDQSLYNIIIAVYRRAMATTGKRYMAVMDGKKISVIEKGKDCKVTLDQSVDIYNASYSDTTENMVNLVKIYNDSLKQLGEVQHKKHVAKYGVYQKTYKKEKGVNAKTEAKGMLVGITKEASVEAIGDTRAIAGTSLQIHDKTTGTGKFYIAADTHTFKDGIHTMKLDLSWSNTMEEGAEETGEKSEKAKLVDSAKAYYLDRSSVYHSSKGCTACEGKANIQTTTVAKIKKILITRGENKGKRKYRACARCWET